MSLSLIQEQAEQELKRARAAAAKSDNDPTKPEFITKLAIQKAAAELAVAQTAYDNALRDYNYNEWLDTLTEKTKEVVNETSEVYAQGAKAIAQVEDARRALGELPLNDPRRQEIEAKLNAIQKEAANETKESEKIAETSVKELKEQRKAGSKNFDGKDGERTKATNKKFSDNQEAVKVKKEKLSRNILGVQEVCQEYKLSCKAPEDITSEEMERAGSTLRLSEIVGGLNSQISEQEKIGQTALSESLTNLSKADADLATSREKLKTLEAGRNRSNIFDQGSTSQPNNIESLIQKASNTF